MSSGFAVPGTVAGAGLAWFGVSAICLTVFFLRDAGAAGALFTGVALTCAVFTAGFAWGQGGNGNRRNQITSWKKLIESCNCVESVLKKAALLSLTGTDLFRPRGCGVTEARHFLHRLPGYICGVAHLQIKGSPSASGTRRNRDGMADAGRG